MVKKWLKQLFLYGGIFGASWFGTGYIANVYENFVSQSSSISTNLNEKNLDSNDIFVRLNKDSSFTWIDDVYATTTGTKVEKVYVVEGCAVWVFPSEKLAADAYSSGLFDTYPGEVWYGKDSYSEKGIALLTTSKNSDCGQEVFITFNWDLLDEINESGINNKNSIENNGNSTITIDDLERLQKEQQEFEKQQQFYDWSQQQLENNNNRQNCIDVANQLGISSINCY